MSDSVQPHRRQPTRLPRPWDSPGKNTGVGCHFFFQCMKVKSESEVTQSCLLPLQLFNHALSSKHSSNTSPAILSSCCPNKQFWVSITVSTCLLHFLRYTPKPWRVTCVLCCIFLTGLVSLAQPFMPWCAPHPAAPKTCPSNNSFQSTSLFCFL